MIDEIKQELEDFVYPDDNQAALDKLHAKSVSTVGSISSSELLEYLTTHKKIAMIYDCANDSEHELQDSCRGTIIAIESGRDIDLSSNGNSQTLSGFVPEIINVVQADEIISKATTVNYPFASVTMQQLRQAKGLTNVVTLTNWVGQRFIRLNVDGVVGESFRPVVTKSNEYYDNEPLGRTTTIDKAGLNVVDISNLSNPGTPTTITIELGAPNSFTAELV